MSEISYIVSFFSDDVNDPIKYSIFSEISDAKDYIRSIMFGSPLFGKIFLRELNHGTKEETVISEIDIANLF